MLHASVAGKPVPEAFGYAKKCRETMYPLFAPQFVQISDSQRESLAQKMQLSIQNKMKESKIPFAAELYKLDDTAFASCKLTILSSAEEALNSGLRELYESKVGLCYIDAGGQWQATTTKQQAKALKKVWLSDEDVETAKAKGTDLRVIYQLRCKRQEKRQKFKAAGLDMP